MEKTEAAPQAIYAQSTFDTDQDGWTKMGDGNLSWSATGAIPVAA